MEKDLYKILGVSESASDQEIKSAYRDLAKKHHPDRHPNDTQNEERFKEVSQAYSVLSDSTKRQKYDQMRRFGGGGNFSGFGGQGQAGGFDFGDIFGGGGGRARSAEAGGFDSFGDIFSQFFGGRQERSPYQKPKSVKPKNVESTITVPFDVAINGGKKAISVSRIEPCSKCEGKGTLNAGFTCHTCGGSGKEKRERKINVTIPAGVENGKKIVLRGQGEDLGNGQNPGDLILTINYEKNSAFERKGFDLYSKANINLAQALFGSKIRVQTFNNGTVELKIPAGTQNGKLFKLKGLGVKAESKSGDHYVEINVMLPDKLDKKGKQLLADFAKHSGLDY